MSAWRHGAAVALIVLGWANGDAQPQPSDSAVETAASIELHSSFWLNLHHFLYAGAQERLASKQRARLAGPSTFAVGEALTEAEQRDWDAALDVYARDGYAAKDLLFDAQMTRIKVALGRAGDSLESVDLPDDLRAALRFAAPVYRRHAWPAHDAANRAWIRQQAKNLGELGPAVTAKLAKLYAAPWPTTPLRADAVAVAKLGGYTSVDPDWIVVAAGDAQSQSWQGTEIVFHEASHTLIDNVTNALYAAARRAGVKIPGDLWHVVLFYCVGEATRQALADRGVAYTAYLYETGLFDRAWPTLRPPVEAALPDYVAGKASLDATMDRLVAALPK